MIPICLITGFLGTGKTTLLKIFLQLVKPTAGSIQFKPNLKIGYMPQKIHLTHLMPLSVEKFLNLAGCKKLFKSHLLFKQNEKANSFKEKVLETVELLGISYLLKSEMYSLSGGELQRVLFARALLNEPELLVLDEPSQGIDAKGQVELYSKISDIKKQYNCAIIIVSHDLHLVFSQTNKVVCLNKHICCSGYPESVCKHPEFVNLFSDNGLHALAIYKHKHDHNHDLEGEIV